MIALKAIAALMAYPDADLQAALPDIRRALGGQAHLPAPEQEALEALIQMLEDQSLGSAQENYVALFDRGRYLSLHLFEHVHGESRDRGQAMVDLMDHYRERGYELDARELPDYIPLFLEFLSTQSLAEVVSMLDDAMPVLVLLGARLSQKGSAYAALFHALEAIGGRCEQAQEMRELAATEGPDESITRMDEIWEEEQVTFMGNQDPAGAGCGSHTPTVNTAPLDEMPVRWVDVAQTPAGQR